jgi:mono/diheme cytochrome c family protein
MRTEKPLPWLPSPILRTVHMARPIGFLASYLLHIFREESTLASFTSVQSRNASFQYGPFCRNRIESNPDLRCLHVNRQAENEELDVIKGKLSLRWNSVRRVSIELAVVGALTIFGLAVAACAPSSPAAPTAAPTVAAAPTAPGAAGTAQAVGTTTAPTVVAAVTALAPTAAAAATAAVSTKTTTTAGQLADAGQAVYTSMCAVCHGAQGEGKIGPALWGPIANYGAFKSAQDLLTFITYKMPLSNPGSLTPEQAMDLTAYLLVQDGIVQRNAPLSPATFGSTQLK